MVMCLPTHASPVGPTPVMVERTTAVSRKTLGKTAKHELQGTTSPLNREKDTHDGMSAVRERKGRGCVGRGQGGRPPVRFAQYLTPA